MELASPCSLKNQDLRNQKVTIDILNKSSSKDEAPLLRLNQKDS